MSPVRRLFVLLSAYEDITERESAALRRGDVEQAITLENRKLRISEEMNRARENAELSDDEIDALNQRVRGLEFREKHNLAFLREEMARVRATLATLQMAVRKTRNVRRGYAGTFGATIDAAEGMLGRA